MVPSPQDLLHLIGASSSGDPLLIGIAAVIAALASLVSALASFWTNRKLTKMELEAKRKASPPNDDYPPE